MFDQTEPSPGITSHENPSAGFTVKRFLPFLDLNFTIYETIAQDHFSFGRA